MTTFSSYDGTTLSYDEVGSGPPLVCLPGGPGRAAVYLEDLGGLAQERTLLRLDLRATGRSEVPADPSSLRFDRMAQDVEALRLRLDLPRLDVLAHSAGTIVAQAWASANPSAVGTLVLVTPSDKLQGGSRSDVAAIRATRSAEPWFAEADDAQQALTDAPLSQAQQLVRLTRPFWYGRWDERTQAHAATAERQSSKRAELGFSAGLEELDLAGLLAGLQAVTAPVLVVGGERDALTGLASVDLVARCFVGASTAVVPGAGHFPWVDEPHAFRDVVAAFLRTGPPA